MTMKKLILATLTGSALLAAAPAFADNGRGGRDDFRSDNRGNRFHGYSGQHFQQRPVVVHRYEPRYAYRPAVVHRPVVVHRQPVVVYREHSSHDVLGGLIVGAVLGAVIANHAGY